MDGLITGLLTSWIGPHLKRIRPAAVVVAIYAIICAAAAAGVSLLIPSTYVAEASLIADAPQSKGLSGTLAQVAGQLGFAAGGLDISSAGRFYGDLMRSRSVLDGLAHTHFADPKSGHLRPLFSILMHSDSLTPRDREDVVRKLGKKLEVAVDARTGVIRVSFGTVSPSLAAAALDSLITQSNRFAIENLQGRARARREFSEEQVTQAKRDLAAIEDSLRAFLEANRRITDSPQLQFEEARLRRRLALREELFGSLSRDLEEARIDEVRDTPVLSLIDPPVPPARRSSPNRRALVLLAFFAGGILASLGVATSVGARVSPIE